MTTPRVKRAHRKAGRKEKPLRATLEQLGTLAGLGLTDEEISLYLGICRKTLAMRRKRNPAIAEAFRRGKVQADVTVVKSLYTRATDHNDTTAMIFWLKNRQPERWRDRRDISGDLNINTRLSLADFKKSMKGLGNEE